MNAAQHPLRAPRATALLAAALGTLAPSLLADDTWNNTGTTWNANSSWVDGVAPNNSSAGNIITFSNEGAGFNSVSFTASRLSTGLVFTSTANAYTFESNSNGYTLSIGSSGISHGATNTQTINTHLIGSTVQSWSTVAGGSLVVATFDLSNSAVNRILGITGAGTITFGGTIANGGTSTTGGINITSTGTTILNGANTYDGTTTMNATGGTLALNGDNSDANGAVTITAGTVRLGHANALGSTTGVTSVSAGAVLDLNGQAIGAETISFQGTGIDEGGALINSTATAASLAGSVTLGANSSFGTVSGGSITLNGAINLNAASTATRTLTLRGAGNYTINGNISNSFAGSTGNIATAADFTGIAILAGTNTYNGATNVAGGTLYVNGTVAGTGANVTGTGRLGGTGTISSAVTIASTAFLTPGTSAGTLTLGDGLTLNGTYAWEINANSEVSGFDAVVVTGGDILLGISSVFDIEALAGVDFSNTFWAADHSWVVINNTGAGSVTGTFVGGLTGDTSNSFGSFSLAYGAGAGGDVTLSWTASAIPEPSTASILAGLAVLGFTGLRRRRS